MTEKRKQKNRPSPLSKHPYVRPSKEEMELIVGEIDSGALKILSACKKYGLNRNTLKFWITRLSVGDLTDKMNKSMSSNISGDRKEHEYKQQISQFEKSLEYARLKIFGLETMIKVAEEDLQIKIRKKPGTKRSKE
ncbi:hypothetical protein [Segetibacter koreensis]|uniref:hypothetical protein n=1 Tax=Segetibacter koreensis TaxID=398037 RepID=UPI000372E43A|nr:hypothetical protein [Segetibacter koreensis]